MYYLNYYLEDRRMDDRYLYSNVAEQGIKDVDYWNTVFECIREDDYVYVYNVTDNVNQMLGMYTAEGVLQEDTIYRIHREEDGIQLEVM